MPTYIELSNDEKRELLNRTSDKKQISQLLIEKDFWVTWLLARVFELDLAQHLTFKGGTSLSKCYGLIHRFSEDCDITIDKSLFSGNVDENSLSGKKFNKRLESNDEQAIHFVHHILKPALEQSIGNHFSDIYQWEITIDEKEPKNLRFIYPSVITLEDSPYIKKSVLLEMGVRGDIYPSETRPISSYIEDTFGDILEKQETTLRVLSPIRTFWEKTTILQAENNRPQEKQFGDRLSRHYYDIYQMIEAGIHQQAIKNIDLLDSIIANKKQYFRTSWAKYEEAIPGSFKLYPNNHLLNYLREDYHSMAMMVFGDTPSFDVILGSIQKLEIELNSITSSNHHN
ncbi:MAG: nucleotidyl transferase AbiEii/AbiGii toxin family protein [Candidatus Paracaedibacteraceae bacterium]|nr:nucleotidyl transferase AbiEii/AbiGii toxin family protein [Candidatus Paracaedibacteraceae bacterium]